MVRNPPIIGVCAYEVPASFSHWSEVSCVMVPSGYTRSLAAAGAIPVVLPPVDGIAGVLDGLDALVLTGGSDVGPEVYGAEPHPETVGVHPHRDRSELELLTAAIDRDLPVLGICRGMQLLNIVRGGTLQQHLADVVADGGLHKGPPGTFTRHAVRLTAGSLVVSLLGEQAEVHSCHHQAPDRIGDGLGSPATQPTALSRRSSSPVPPSAWGFCGTRRRMRRAVARCSAAWWRPPAPARPAAAGFASAPERAGRNNGVRPRCSGQAEVRSAARMASISSSRPTPFLRQLVAPAANAASIICGSS
jgi:gamma-glutamyl-gamma-aminobutyrate hydrolase PuuD